MTFGEDRRVIRLPPRMDFSFYRIRDMANESRGYKVLGLIAAVVLSSASIPFHSIPLHSIPFPFLFHYYTARCILKDATLLAWGDRRIPRGRYAEDADGDRGAGVSIDPHSVAREALVYSRPLHASRQTTVLNSLRYIKTRHNLTLLHSMLKLT